MREGSTGDRMRSAAVTPVRLDRRRALRLLSAAAATPALGACTASSFLSEFEDGGRRRAEALAGASIDALRAKGQALVAAHLTARFGKPTDTTAEEDQAALSLTFGQQGLAYRSETFASAVSTLGRIDGWHFGPAKAGKYYLVSFAVRTFNEQFSASPGLPAFLDPEGEPAAVEFELQPGEAAYLGHIRLHLELSNRAYRIVTEDKLSLAREALADRKPGLEATLASKPFRCNGCPRF